MKLNLFPVLFMCVCLSAMPVKADSPLTSTYFAENYPEYPIISQTSVNRTFNAEIAAFLLDKKMPIDAKAALINAIGWNYDGTSNADQFKVFLAEKYGTTTGGLQMSALNADELMCLGYIMAMDNYFIVDDAINIIQMARDKKPSSFTINMILAMVRAQKAMDTSFCDVWKFTSEVLNDKSLKRDMKRVSIQNIVDYMVLYKSECYY